MGYVETRVRFPSPAPLIVNDLQTSASKIDPGFAEKCPIYYLWGLTRLKLLVVRAFAAGAILTRSLHVVRLVIGMEHIYLRRASIYAHPAVTRRHGDADLSKI